MDSNLIVNQQSILLPRGALSIACSAHGVQIRQPISTAAIASIKEESKAFNFLFIGQVSWDRGFEFQRSEQLDIVLTVQCLGWGFQKHSRQVQQSGCEEMMLKEMGLSLENKMIDM